MPKDSPAPRRRLESFEGIQEGGLVNHALLHVAAVLKVCDQRQHVIDAVFLDAISGTLSAKQPMGRKQPKSSLIGCIELR